MQYFVVSESRGSRGSQGRSVDSVKGVRAALRAAAKTASIRGKSTVKIGSSRSDVRSRIVAHCKQLGVSRGKTKINASCTLSALGRKLIAAAKRSGK